MKNLKDVLECPKQALYREKIKENIMESPGFIFKKCLRELLNNVEFEKIGMAENVNEYFAPWFDLSVMKKERDFIKKALTLKLKRLVIFFQENDFVLLEVNKLVQTPLTEGIENRIQFDLVFKKGESINYILIKNGKLDYTKGEATKKYPGTSNKLFSMWKAIEPIRQQSQTPIYVGEIGLTSKKETSKVSLLELDVNPLRNADLMRYSFSQDEEEAFDEKIRKIRTIQWNKNTPKTDDVSHCEFCSYQNLCKFKKVKKVNPVAFGSSAKKMAEINFSREQLAYINQEEGCLRILAAAGSGKTTCTINRLIELLLKGNSIKDFLLITFTEKGVQEMKDKLGYWLNVNNLANNLDEFQIFTFNSFGDKVLKDNYKLLGFTDTPYLIDENEQIKIIKSLLDEAPFKIEGMNYQKPLLKMFKAEGVIFEALRIITRIKELAISDFNDFKSKKEFGTIDFQGVWKIYNEYISTLVNQNRIDYADQLFLVLNLFRKHPEITKKYCYKHILLDEFQDTSKAQLELIDKMMEAGNNNGTPTKSFAVCGDDAQAIYGFRGVDMKNIIDFDKIYPTCKDFYLLDNFRSTKEIISLANNVITMSTTNLRKVMRGHKKGQLPIFVDSNSRKLSKQIQREAIGDLIVKAAKRRINEQGDALSDIAIIARGRMDLEAIANKLDREKIPYYLAVPEKYIDNINVRALKGLIAMILGISSLLDVANYTQVCKTSEFETAFDVTSYLNLFQGIVNEDVASLNEEEKQTYMKTMLPEIKEDTTLIALFQRFEEKGYDTLEAMYHWLEDAFLYQSNESALNEPINADAITLTTAHSAKGREWMTVLLSTNTMLPMGTCIDNNRFEDDFHKIMSVRNLAEEEINEHDESIRLLFVAITRAMEHLEIFY